MMFEIGHERRVALTSRHLSTRSEITSARSRGDVDVLELPTRSAARYTTGIASSDRAIDEALRLRYRVFNLELGEGLTHSNITGLDRDEFDEQMTHLVLLDLESRSVVGTYRLQPVPHARLHRGVYCEREYDLAALAAIEHQAVECGRACVEREHRSYAAIVALWLGIGVYMDAHRLRYLFGCCSLTSTDPDDGWRAMKTLRSHGWLHPELFTPTRPTFHCGPSDRERAPDLGAPIPLPKLFRAYVNIGAKVVSEPAIDHEFGTVDFLMLLDGLQVTDPRLRVLETR